MGFSLRWLGRQVVRTLTSWLPRPLRFDLYRSMVKCDAALPDKLVFKLAETREELEACFRLLHDAYVGAGFMKPDPSGMRATLYHALPTTSTLLAKHGDRVVGTISLIRESTLGFPMQRIFDISDIRSTGGNIAEVSALAIDPRFRSTGGLILFPLMKFMYEYATKMFDTRYLVIAVNPRHIPLYESLLFFKRLRQNTVAHYDFVNGAPAVGACLDLQDTRPFIKHYGKKPPGKNLYEYFTALKLPNIVFPDKRFFTTNDPVMTPQLIDYFFNHKTQTFARTTDRERVLLHAIYDLAVYKRCLPPLPADTHRTELKHRQHQRFSVSCPAVLSIRDSTPRSHSMRVIECSRTGFRARTDRPLPVGSVGTVTIDLGELDHCRMSVRVVRLGQTEPNTALFKIEEPDFNWRKFVNALRMARTHEDLADATRFMPAEQA